MITKKENEILLFMYKYKIISKSDMQCFFDTKDYYRKQIANMLKKQLIRQRDDKYIVISEDGIKYIRSLGYTYRKLTYEKQFIERLKNISSIATSFYNNKNIEFIPSFDFKDKSKFTICSRKYVGIFSINKKDYLAYYVSKEHEDKYIRSIFFDIQKEKKYRSIIIFIEDIEKIPIKDYKFGLNEILIIPFIEDNRQLLSKIAFIDWYDILYEIYPNEKVILSKYDLIDYITNKNKYINVFSLIDSEKIHSCKLFLQENKSKQLDIVCNKDILENLKKEIPKANYKTIELNNIKEPIRYD